MYYIYLLPHMRWRVFAFTVVGNEPVPEHDFEPIIQSIHNYCSISRHIL